MRPLRKPRPNNRRHLTLKAMTVCIAAACNQGRHVVVATDGLLSYGGITADVIHSKIRWLDDWLCMYAGEPSNTKMIFEELHSVAREQRLTRANIKTFIRAAYQKRRDWVAASRVLAGYDMNLDEFKKDGPTIFVQGEFERLSKELQQEGKCFAEQILVVGWGATEYATMIYEVSPDRDGDHADAGFTAIGSGAEVAIANLMLLEQGRQCSIDDTLYSVASAKFAAEKSQDRDVGDRTTLYVAPLLSKLTALEARG